MFLASIRRTAAVEHSPMGGPRMPGERGGWLAIHSPPAHDDDPCGPILAGSGHTQRSLLPLGSSLERWEFLRLHDRGADRMRRKTIEHCHCFQSMIHDDWGSQTSLSLPGGVSLFRGARRHSASSNVVDERHQGRSVVSGWLWMLSMCCPVHLHGVLGSCGCSGSLIG